MSTQKRYTKKFEIEVEILKLRRKARGKLIDCEAGDQKIREMLMEANAVNQTPGNRQFLIEQSDFIRKKVARMRRTIELVHEEHIPRLVRTLAAFQTQTFEFVEDASITLQK